MYNITTKLEKLPLTMPPVNIYKIARWMYCIGNRPSALNHFSRMTIAQPLTQSRSSKGSWETTVTKCHRRGAKISCRGYCYQKNADRLTHRFAAKSERLTANRIVPTQRAVWARTREASASTVRQTRSLNRIFRYCLLSRAHWACNYLWMT